jgi:hypothetical protein
MLADTKGQADNYSKKKLAMQDITSFFLYSVKLILVQQLHQLLQVSFSTLRHQL